MPSIPEIRQKLLKWLRDPDAYSDEGVEPPSRTAVSNALNVARCLTHRSSQFYVVMDGDGGVVFEYANENGSVALHFWPDGSVEKMKADADGNLVERKQVKDRDDPN